MLPGYILRLLVTVSFKEFASSPLCLWIQFRGNGNDLPSKDENCKYKIYNQSQPIGNGSNGIQ